MLPKPSVFFVKSVKSSLMALAGSLFQRTQNQQGDGDEEQGCYSVKCVVIENIARGIA